MSSSSTRVHSLITMAGLTQPAYAEHLGLEPTKLSKFLAGARCFTSLELARISELSGVTVDWLLTGTEPDLTIAARSITGSAAAAVQQAEHLSSLRSDLAFLGFPQPWLPVVTDTGGTFRATATRVADAARERVEAIGRSTTETDLASVVEAAFGADVAICTLGSQFDGLAVTNDEVKLILVSTSQTPAQQRFTIAHELGHLLSTDDQRLHCDSDIYADSYRHHPSEQRANAFAAAFLLPETVLQLAVGTKTPTAEIFTRLATDLGVSPPSLALRLRDLRLIDSGSYNRLRRLSSAETTRQAGRRPDAGRARAGRSELVDALVSTASPGRPPGLLLRDTYRAYETGAATLRPYANLLGADVDELAKSLTTDLGRTSA